MSKDSNNNNLEDFFRNSLKNYSENPSDDLWSRIEGNIPPKPSRKVRPAYVLLALLLLLSFGLGYEYFHFKNQMVAVSETVDVQKQELNQLRSELESVKGQLQTATNPVVIESNSTGNELEPTSQNSSSKIPERKGPLSTSLDASKAIITISNDKKEMAAETFETNESVTQETSIQTERTLENETLAAAPVISLDYLVSKPIAAEVLTDDKLPLSISLPKKAGKPFSLEIYAAALKTFPNSSQKTDNEAQVNGCQLSSDFGALFTLGLNKNWDVQLGVGYNRMVINDAVSADLIYSRDELDPSRGTYSSFYSYTVTTPSGEIAVSTALSNQRINDGRDLEEGDPFQLDLQYQDVIQYFELPVFVRYKVGSGRYRFTVKGGFVQKFLLSEKILLSSVNPDFERLENDMSHISNNQTSASTTSVDALFGAGAEYKLSKRNSLHLQSTFSYSLQEIYPGSKPFSVGLNLGLQHRLGK